MSTTISLQKGVKCIQSQQERHQYDIVDVLLVLLRHCRCTFGTFGAFNFAPISSVFVVDFEQVNICLLWGTI